MSEPTVRRRHVFSGSPYEPKFGISRAIRVGCHVWVTATAPIWPDGSCDPDPELQAQRCVEIIVAALREAGAEPRDVVRTRTYLISARDGDAVMRVHGTVFGEARPASSVIVVSGFLDPRWKVEIEVEAVVP